jgi:hypothetical protein
MDVHELGRMIEAVERTDQSLGHHTVVRAYASNTMSDLIAHAAPDVLLVTALNNNQLIRVADLMDVPGICLVSNASPSPELLARAAEVGTAILVARTDLAATLQAIDRHLGLHAGAAS